MKLKISGALLWVSLNPWFDREEVSVLLWFEYVYFVWETWSSWWVEEKIEALQMEHLDRILLMW